MRAYKIATTPPMGPVLITADGDLAEEAVHDEKKLRIPKLTMSIPPQGDSGAVTEAAKMLVAAQNPVILADRACRSQEGMKRIVEFAEALNAPVADIGGRMNFPTTHYLCRSLDKRSLVGQADVVLMLEVADPWGQFNTISDPHHEYRRLVQTRCQNHPHFSRRYADESELSGHAALHAGGSGDLRRCAGDLAGIDRGGEERHEHVAARRDRRPRDQTARRPPPHEGPGALGGGARAGMPPRAARRACRRSCTIAIKNEKWCVAVSSMQWNRNLWPATEYYNFIGGSGGAGQGYGAPAAVGAALANRDKGIITVSIEGDGDLMYAPGSLWTAAHHKIPLLMIVHNNRAYHQEVMHLQKMASLHNRRMDTAAIGTTIENPNIDFAKLAQSMGVFAERGRSTIPQRSDRRCRALSQW